MRKIAVAGAEEKSTPQQRANGCRLETLLELFGPEVREEKEDGRALRQQRSNLRY